MRSRSDIPVGGLGEFVSELCRGRNRRALQYCTIGFSLWLYLWIRLFQELIYIPIGGGIVYRAGFDCFGMLGAGWLLGRLRAVGFGRI